MLSGTVKKEAIPHVNGNFSICYGFWLWNVLQSHLLHLCTMNVPPVTEVWIRTSVNTNQKDLIDNICAILGI